MNELDALEQSLSAAPAQGAPAAPAPSAPAAPGNELDALSDTIHAEDDTVEKLAKDKQFSPAGYYSQKKTPEALEFAGKVEEARHKASAQEPIGDKAASFASGAGEELWSTVKDGWQALHLPGLGDWDGKAKSGLGQFVQGTTGAVFNAARNIVSSPSDAKWGDTLDSWLIRKKAKLDHYDQLKFLQDREQRDYHAQHGTLDGFKPTVEIKPEDQVTPEERAEYDTWAGRAVESAATLRAGAHKGAQTALKAYRWAKDKVDSPDNFTPSDWQQRVAEDASMQESGQDVRTGNFGNDTLAQGVFAPSPEVPQEERKRLVAQGTIDPERIDLQSSIADPINILLMEGLRIPIFHKAVGGTMALSGRAMSAVGRGIDSLLTEGAARHIAGAGLAYGGYYTAKEALHGDFKPLGVALGLFAARYALNRGGALTREAGEELWNPETFNSRAAMRAADAEAAEAQAARASGAPEEGALSKAWDNFTSGPQNAAATSRIARRTIQGVGTGVAGAVPFGALADTPEEAGHAYGGGAAFGGFLGPAGGALENPTLNRAAEINKAATQRLADTGAAIRFDDPALQRQHEEGMQGLNYGERTYLDALKGLFSAFRTPQGRNMNIAVLGPEDYVAHATRLTGSTDAEGLASSHGLYDRNTGTVYINRGHLRLDSAAHEGGHFLTDEVMRQLGKAYGDVLRRTVEDGLFDGDKPTADFQRFINEYNRRTPGQPIPSDRGRRDILQHRAVGEYLAETTRSILGDRNVGRFILPKDVSDRMADRLVRLYGNATAGSRGRDLFERTDLPTINQAVRNVIFDLGSGMRPDPSVTGTARRGSGEAVTPPDGSAPSTPGAPAPGGAPAAPQTGGTPENGATATATNPAEPYADVGISTEVADAARDFHIAPPGMEPRTQRANRRRGVEGKSADTVANERAQEWESMFAQYVGFLRANGLRVPNNTLQLHQDVIAFALRSDAGARPSLATENPHAVTPAAPASIETKSTVAPAALEEGGPAQSLIEERNNLTRERDQHQPGTIGRDRVEARINELDGQIAELEHGARTQAADEINGALSVGADGQEAAPTPPQPTAPGDRGALEEPAPAPEPPPRREPAPVHTEQEVQQRVTDAENEVVQSPEYQRKRKESTREKARRQARIGALLGISTEHAQRSGDGDLLQYRVNPDGTNARHTGRLDPENIPAHRLLLDELGVQPDGQATIDLLDNQVGHTVYLDYGSAPKAEGRETNTTGEQRREEYKASDTEDRRTGGATAEQKSKAFHVLGFKVWPDKGTVTLFGFSPDKWIANTHKLLSHLQEQGVETGYSGVNDPQLMEDMQGYVRNHQNGYKGDGSGPVSGAQAQGQPYQISRQRFDVLNAALNFDISTKGGSARENTQRGALEAQERAEENNWGIDPDTGDTNPLRAFVNKSGKLVTPDGTPGTAANLEGVYEHLSPDLVRGISETPGKAELVRPVGFTGDPGEGVQRGIPNRTYAEAGFMPDSGSRGALEEDAGGKPRWTPEGKSEEEKSNVARNIKNYGFPPEEFGMTQEMVDKLNAELEARIAASREPELPPADTKAAPKKFTRVTEDQLNAERGDADDGFYYHVTTPAAARAIEKSGKLVAGKRGTMASGYYADYSSGKVFLTDRDAVQFWRNRIGEHLDANGRPDKTVVMRIPKDALSVPVHPDLEGTRDARTPAYYAEKEAFMPDSGSEPGVLEDDASSIETKSPKELQAGLDAIRKDWESRGIDSWASIKGGDITLSQIEVPKDQRGQGKGTAAMQQLLDFAQENGLRVLLTPDASLGGSSKGRLRDFYKGLGFTDNKGRNKDYRTQEAMIWRPDGYEKNAYIPESGGGELMPGEKMSEEDRRAFESAKQNHGITRNIEEAGYVLPDGTMLDFSGRAQMSEYEKAPDGTWKLKNPGRDWQAGERQIDHREVTYDGAPEREEGSYHENMVDFLRRGAVRIDAKAGLISVDGRKPLTRQQEAAVREIVQRNNGQVYLDMEDGRDRAAISFDTNSPTKVVGMLKRWARGETPESGDAFMPDSSSIKTKSKGALEDSAKRPEQMPFREYYKTQFDEERHRHLPEDYFGESQFTAKRDGTKLVKSLPGGIELREGDYNILYAFDGDRNIGHGDGTAFVVDPEYQRRGVGTEMLSYFKDQNPNKPIGSVTPAGQMLTVSYHRKTVRDALAEGRPVSIQAVKDYGLTVPKGYAEQGGQYVNKGGEFMPGSRPALEDVDSLGFYSGLRRIVDAKIPNRASGDQILATLKGAGAKAEEMDTIGLPEFLHSHEGPVTKQELQDFVKAGGVQLKEVAKGKQEKEFTDFLVKNHNGTEWRFDTEDEFESWKENKIQKSERQWNEEMSVIEERPTEDDDGNPIGEPTYLVRDRGGWESETFHSREEAEDHLRDVARENAEQGFDDDYRVKKNKEVSTSDNTKFSQYTLPGGENYKEVLLTLPESGRPLERSVVFVGNGYEVRGMEGKTFPTEDAAIQAARASNNYREPFKSSHWDEPNVLAHIRQADHTDTDGNKVRLIEEMQSDWHQKGRKEGYQPQPRDMDAARDALKAAEDKYRASQAKLQELYRHREESPEAEKAWMDYRQEHKRINDELGRAQEAAEKTTTGVPDGPFKASWRELAFKRALRMAVEDGMDKIAWTPGEVHTKRWGTERIEWHRQPDGSFLLDAKSQHGGEAAGIDLEAEAQARGLDKSNSTKVSSMEELEDAIRPVLTEGQDPEALAKKLWDRMQSEDQGVSMPRKEGFEGFYDKILPDFVKKYVKKMGGKVEVATVNAPKGTYKFDDFYSWYSKEHSGGKSRSELQRVWNEDVNNNDPTFDQWRKERGQVKVHSVTITPEMKKAIMSEGQPMFMPGQRRGALEETPAAPTPRIRTARGALEEDDKDK